MSECNAEANEGESALETLIAFFSDSTTIQCHTDEYFQKIDVLKIHIEEDRE